MVEGRKRTTCNDLAYSPVRSSPQGTATHCPLHMGAQGQAALTRAVDKLLSDARAARGDRGAPVRRLGLPHDPLYPPAALSPERVSHLISRVRVQHPDRPRLPFQILGPVLRKLWS